jgi:hypothetical protein
MSNRKTDTPPPATFVRRKQPLQGGHWVKAGVGVYLTTLTIPSHDLVVISAF